MRGATCGGCNTGPIARADLGEAPDLLTRQYFESWWQRVPEMRGAYRAADIERLTQRDQWIGLG
jgi:hypothetical protein